MAATLSFFLLALACEIIGTIGGFGSSFIFVPLAQSLLPFQLVLILTSMLHIFSNAIKIILFRKTINLKLTLLFGIPSLLFTIIGAFLTTRIDSIIPMWVLSIFLIFFSITLFMLPRFTIPASTPYGITGGCVAGFLAGFTGTGGAVRGICLAAFNLEKNFFVGTSAAVDMGVDLSRFVIYWKSNFMNAAYNHYIPVIIIASLSGSYVGKLLLNKINQDTFRKIVLSLTFLIGTIMLVRLIGS